MSCDQALVLTVACSPSWRSSIFCKLNVNLMGKSKPQLGPSPNTSHTAQFSSTLKTRKTHDYWPPLHLCLLSALKVIIHFDVATYRSSKVNSFPPLSVLTHFLSINQPLPDPQRWLASRRQRHEGESKWVMKTSITHAVSSGNVVAAQLKSIPAFLSQWENHMCGVTMYTVLSV